MNTVAEAVAALVPLIGMLVTWVTSRSREVAHDDATVARIVDEHRAMATAPVTIENEKTVRELIRARANHDRFR